MSQNQIINYKLIKILGVVCVILFIITMPLMSKYMYERDLTLNKNNCLSNHDVWSKNYVTKDYSCTIQDQYSVVYAQEYNIVKFNDFWEWLR